MPFYYNTHFQIIVAAESNSTLSKKNSKKLWKEKRQKKPNVLLFVIDSMSNSNWRRNLPKTLKFLKDKYRSIIFKSFVKVGDNSFPNAVSFLTG